LNQGDCWVTRRHEIIPRSNQRP